MKALSAELRQSGFFRLNDKLLSHAVRPLHVWMQNLFWFVKTTIIDKDNFS